MSSRQTNVSRNVSQQQQQQQQSSDQNTIKQIAQDMMLLNAINAAGSRLTLDNYSGLNSANSNTTSQRSVQPSRNTGNSISKSTNNNNNNNSSSNNNTNSNNSYYNNQQQLQQGGNNFHSEVEAAILRSNVPLDLNESEEITVNGERGVWVNKNEISNWRGSLPLAQYPINDDPHPEIIRKRTDQQLQYMQEVAIRYLRPPTPPPPGEILIQKESNIVTPPAPPLVIRQQPPRPITPPPLVIREAPPPPPPCVGRKVITISGKRIPPPPRKVIIERLPPMPSKPQSVIIERWLPYRQVKRRVIYMKANNDKESVVCKPKNVIIQWEPPKVQIKKEFKDLGVVKANPIDYVERYGSSLKRAMELPPFVKEIKPPAGVVLAADSNSTTVYELEGDVYALNLVDLEREGLVEYRYLLKQVKASESVTPTETTTTSSQVEGAGSSGNSTYSKNQGSSSLSQQRGLSQSGSSRVTEIIRDIIKLFNMNDRNTISLTEAHNIISRSSQRMGRKLEDDEIREFFHTVEMDAEGMIDICEFQRVFERLFK